MYGLQVYLLNTLLLLHFTFMLNAVKTEDATKRGWLEIKALNTHGNYIFHHGKSWKYHGIVFLSFRGNSVSSIV